MRTLNRVLKIGGTNGPRDGAKLWVCCHSLYLTNIPNLYAHHRS